MKLKCCHADCQEDAEWAVYAGPMNEVYVCTEHVQYVLDPEAVNILYPLASQLAWPIKEAVNA